LERSFFVASETFPFILSGEVVGGGSFNMVYRKVKGTRVR
jgi:hypothetical protein